VSWTLPARCGGLGQPREAWDSHGRPGTSKVALGHPSGPGNAEESAKASSEHGVGFPEQGLQYRNKLKGLEDDKSGGENTSVRQSDQLKNKVTLPVSVDSCMDGAGIDDNAVGFRGVGVEEQVGAEGATTYTAHLQNISLASNIQRKLI
jgi:hypothetical protein